MEAHVSEAKKELVKGFENLAKNSKTILIASIKNIPASQLQEIRKELRNKAVIKVPKRSLILRALDSLKKEELKKFKEKIIENVAVLFSNLDSFELAAELIKNKRPAGAKAGQEAPEDIEIPAGPTELVPGPAISELGALGIKVQVENGKISIKEPKVIVKKGEKISAEVAGIMNKLDIKPFSIGLIPIAAFDIEKGELYLDIKIDNEEAVKDLKNAFGKALPFAVEIGYICKDTILFLLQKSEKEAKALEKFAEGKEEKKEEGKEETSENKKNSESQEKESEEKSAESKDSDIEKGNNRKNTESQGQNKEEQLTEENSKSQSEANESERASEESNENQTPEGNKSEGEEK